MNNLTKDEIEQILFDPENQPHQFGKMIWNGNELVFESHPDVGIAGIASNMPDKLGEEIAHRFNNQIDFESVVRPVLKYLCDNHHPHTTIIITPTTAELFEGQKSIGQVLDYVRD
jgi:hypothetical protein